MHAADKSGRYFSLCGAAEGEKIPLSPGSGRRICPDAIVLCNGLSNHSIIVYCSRLCQYPKKKLPEALKSDCRQQELYGFILQKRGGQPAAGLLMRKAAAAITRRMAPVIG